MYEIIRFALNWLLSSDFFDRASRFRCGIEITSLLINNSNVFSLLDGVPTYLRDSLEKQQKPKLCSQTKKHQCNSK